MSRILIETNLLSSWWMVTNSQIRFNNNCRRIINIFIIRVQDHSFLIIWPSITLLTTSMRSYIARSSFLILIKLHFERNRTFFLLKSAYTSSKSEQNFAPRDRPSLNAARLKCLETGGDKLRKKENVEAKWRPRQFLCILRLHNLLWIWR